MIDDSRSESRERERERERRRERSVIDARIAGIVIDAGSQRQTTVVMVLPSTEITALPATPRGR